VAGMHVKQSNIWDTVGSEKTRRQEDKLHLLSDKTGRCGKMYYGTSFNTTMPFNRWTTWVSTRYPLIHLRVTQTINPKRWTWPVLWFRVPVNQSLGARH
jgi:hypothetical protein